MLTHYLCCEIKSPSGREVKRVNEHGLVETYIDVLGVNEIYSSKIHVLVGLDSKHTMSSQPPLSADITMSEYGFHWFSMLSSVISIIGYQVHTCRSK